MKNIFKSLLKIIIHATNQLRYLGHCAECTCALNLKHMKIVQIYTLTGHFANCNYIIIIYYCAISPEPHENSRIEKIMKQNYNAKTMTKRFAKKSSLSLIIQRLQQGWRSSFNKGGGLILNVIRSHWRSSTYHLSSGVARVESLEEGK